MNRAIALDDQSYFLWKVRGGLRRWDDFAGRRLDLGEALKLSPNDLSITALIGLLEFDSSNWAEAGRLFDQALDKLPKDFGVLSYRSMVALKLGDLRTAKKYYDTALAVASGPGDFSRICGYFATEGIALDWAISACNRAVAADPVSANYRIDRGLTKLRLGDLDGAIADYDQAIARNPDLAYAYYGRAIAQLRKGDRTAAATGRERALAIEPMVDEAFVAHGLGELESGQAR